MGNSESKFCSCLYYSANALSRIMTKMADQEFGKSGLSSSYALLLMAVTAKPGIQPTEICQQMKLSPSTVTRLIEKLEYKELLNRTISGRTTQVFPTKKGIKLNKEVLKAWKNLSDRYSKIIGEEKSNDLTASIGEAIGRLNEI